MFYICVAVDRDMEMTFDQLDLNGTYNYADYLKWTFSERLELIKGKIFKMSPAPSRKHQSISTNLSGTFFQYLKKTPCKLYSAPFDIRLTPLKGTAGHNQIFTVVQPDICIVCDLDKLDERGCIGAPDLIIEILSPGNSRKELKEKYEVYEENGVREYWMVDSTERAIFIYQLNENGRFIGLRPRTEGEIVTTPIVPGFSMMVSDIFED
jgi:Uma2 family endonuclease